MSTHADHEEILRNALQLVSQDPTNDAGWEAAESSARALQRPDEVIERYREALERTDSPGIASKLGERALAFLEEWSGDTAARVVVLDAVLRADASDQWAFERLTMLYTVDERWDDLLSLYDRTLAATPEGDVSRRRALLLEASNVAREFAAQPERAAGYLEALFALDPTEPQTARALERLYERQGRHRDLIGLWSTRLAHLDPAAARAQRARIAALYLDALHDPAGALQTATAMLDAGGDRADAWAVLERLGSSDDPTVSRQALAMLRTQYDQAGRVDDVLRVLHRVLEVSSHDDDSPTLRELSDRLRGLGREPEAMPHLARLLALSPRSDEALDEITAAAGRTGRHGVLVDALIEAARSLGAAGGEGSLERRLALLMRAAEVRATVLGDAPGAVALYREVLDAPGAPALVALESARHLETLLADSDDRGARLDAMERLAGLEDTTAAQVETWARAAALAQSIGAHERAVAAWRARLQLAPGDAASLDALASLLEDARRWDELVDVLRARSAAASDDDARRGDLTAVAKIQADELGRTDDAIATWRQVREAFGEDVAVVDALSLLLARAERWSELLELLERASATEADPVRRAMLKARAGDVFRARGDSPEETLAAYRAALDDAPGQLDALAGMRAMLDVPSAHDAATAALDRAFRRTGDWGALVDLAEHRLAATAEVPARLEVLRESAEIAEQRQGDARRALALLARALPLSASAGADGAELEPEIERLAQQVGEWSIVADAYRAASAASPEAASHRLALRLGEILEGTLDDREGALDAFVRVARADRSNLRAATATVRVGAACGRWDAAAEALVTTSGALGRIDPALSDAFDAAVDGCEDPAACWALALSAADAQMHTAVLPDPLKAALLTWAASRHQRGRGDLDAAEAFLGRAVALDDGDVARLQQYAALQRRSPGHALVETLRSLEVALGDVPESIGVLREAAEVELATGGDRASVLELLSALKDRSAEHWKRGDESARPHATWAMRTQVDLYAAGGEHPEAVAVLIKAADELPFSVAESRALRAAAAERSARDLGDTAGAITLYEALYGEAPNDAHIIARLADLYDAAGMRVELLSLRRHELSLTDDASRRMQLRMDIARNQRALGDDDGALATYSENLEEEPGHPETIAALTGLLDVKRARELHGILAAQASALDAAGVPGAEALWMSAAKVAERDLHDDVAAIDGYGRIAARGDDPVALDGLARLHLARNEPTIAATYLERRLARATGDERRPVVAALSRVYVASGDPERARSVLEAQLASGGDAGELRSHLAALYRESGRWEPLAALLSEPSDGHAPSSAELREAAEILHQRLDAPERAVPVLEAASAASPDDRGLRIALANALRASGRLDEARAILDALLEAYGRQRPPERAHAHHQLALIARARGDLPEALAQLDLASSIDMGHPGVFRLLGELAREAGQLDRAERAFRALLLIVRRQTAPSDDLPRPAEVLLELFRIARDLGQHDRAAETLETAFEVSSRSDADALRFEQALRSMGEHEVLLRALRSRLEREREPSARASALADTATLLDEQLSRPAEALDALLEALALRPLDAGLHDAAARVARATSQVPRYEATLRSALDVARAGSDPSAVGTLSLRLAFALAHDLGDLTGAVALYREAAAQGDDEIQVAAWWGLDHALDVLGDTAGRIEVLRLLTASEGDAARGSAWSLAALLLASQEPADVEEGLTWIAWVQEHSPDLPRAAQLLQSAASSWPERTSVLDLYERVAREADDRAALLDVLERRAASPEASWETLHQAVELALDLQLDPRAEALLRRAIAIGEERDEAREATWAMVALARLRETAGDPAEAVRWLRAAAAQSEADEAMHLELRVAALAAGPLDDLRLAASTYEALHARDPGNRAVWEPLLIVYRRLGDEARLEALIEESVSNVFDPADRKHLRMERARILLARPGGEEAAMESLRALLDEDPDDTAATTLLADLYERAGRHEDLAELLFARFDSARERSDAEGTRVLGLRLAGLLAPTRRDRAVDVMRSALEVLPDDAELLATAHGLMTADDPAEERAGVLERLLSKRSGAEAAALAMQLAQLREQTGDAEGIERALEAGFAATPGDEVIRGHLEARYAARGDHAALASVRERYGRQLGDPGQRAAALREAAAMYRDALGDPARAAALLGDARADAPEDLGLLAEYARTLTAAGDGAAAIAAVGEALERGVGGEPMVAPLLRLRAELRGAAGDGDGAVEDLEAAYLRVGDVLAGEFAAALDRRRMRALADGDTAAARSSLLRLTEVLPRIGRVAEGTALLAEWVTGQPDDLEALRRLAALHAEAGRWDDAAVGYHRLVALEQGEARADAAVRLADACAAAGRPTDAREGLQRAYGADLGNTVLRDRLRQLYEALGLFHEAARLWTDAAERSTDASERFDGFRKAGEVLLDNAAEPALAIEPLERAHALRPGDHDVTVLLVDAYTASQRLEDASGLLNTAIAAHKNRRSKELAMLQHRMGRLAYAAGDHAVEMAWLNAALDTDPQNGQVAAELADVAMEQANFDIAQKALRAIALMKNPAPMSRAMAFLRQGVIARSQGDAKKAVFLARKALSEDANLEEARAFLREIGAE